MSHKAVSAFRVSFLAMSASALLACGADLAPPAVGSSGAPDSGARPSQGPPALQVDYASPKRPVVWLDPAEPPGLSRVSFSVLGTNQGGRLDAPPYRFAVDTASLADGWHVVEVLEEDASLGALTDAVSLPVNNTPPDAR